MPQLFFPDLNYFSAMLFKMSWLCKDHYHYVEQLTPRFNQSFAIFFVLYIVFCFFKLNNKTDRRRQKINCEKDKLLLINKFCALFEINILENNCMI